jgi:uncharacterized protein (TIGR02099 family)
LTTPHTPASSIENAADRLVDTLVDHVPQPLREPLETPTGRRIGALIWRGVLIAYFLFGVLLLALRYVVMPEVANYRPDVERVLSTTLQRTVKLGSLEGYWVGLRPALRLRDMTIYDDQMQAGLKLKQVDALLAWDSFLAWDTYLTRFVHLEIQAPHLYVHRYPDARLFVAGIEVTPSPDSDNVFGDWLIAQDRIVIRDATVLWQDDQREAPPLEIPNVDIRLENSGRHHRFGVVTGNLRPMGGRIDLRGDLIGRDAGEIAQWSGQLYLAVDDANISEVRPWFDMPPQLTRGQGDLRVWLDLADSEVRELTLDMNLTKLHSQMAAHLAPLDLAHLEGRIRLENQAKLLTLSTQKLSLATESGQRLLPLTMDLRIDRQGDDITIGQGSLNDLDISVLSSIANRLPLPNDLNALLSSHAPQGRISELRLGWRSVADTLERWNINGRFAHMSLQAQGATPGMRNVGGHILGDQNSGRLTIEGRDMAISLPSIFPQAELPLTQAEAVVEWSRPSSKSPYLITLRRSAFANDDLAGSSSGSWQAGADGSAGTIDLSAKLDRANAKAVWRYLPSSLSPATRDWLRESIRDGVAKDAVLTLRGDLADFPFPKPEQGLFEVKGKIHNAQLLFTEGWPSIDQIDGELLFHGSRMLISAKTATSQGVALRDVRAEITDLDAPITLLAITGIASGATNDMLSYVVKSPVSEMIGHATKPMQATGNATLDLDLKIPLDTPDESKVLGALALQNNTLTVMPGLPTITDLQGQLQFTERALSAKELRGQFLGGPAHAEIRTEKEVISINAQGEVKIAGLKSVLPAQTQPVLGYLSGTTRWQGTLNAKPQGVDVSVTSNLVGLSSSLPVPFAKTAADSAPLRFELKPVMRRVAVTPARAARVANVPSVPSVTRTTTTTTTTGTARAAPVARSAMVADDSFDLSIGKQIRAQWLLSQSSATSPATLLRGGVTIGRAPIKQSDREVLINIDVPEIDMAIWPGVIASLRDDEGSKPDTSPVFALDIHTERLWLGDRLFPDFRLSGKRSVDASGFAYTHTDIRSPLLTGTVDYREVGAGVLSGKLQRLSIPAPSRTLPTAVPTSAAAASDPLVPKALPKTDIVIEHLLHKGSPLGRLTLNAINQDARWEAKIGLRNPDAALEGALIWSSNAATAEGTSTQSDVRMDISNLDGFMSRIGYPGTLRQGKAHADAKLSWHGAPTSIDFETLNGTFAMDAKDGQFNKLEPGVGRLLGIVSLQSIPRRISLDFRDVFSAGFAFDTIAGNFTVRQGVMTTDNLSVRGPAARVHMRGKIDLAQETQQLTVRVQPSLSDSIAVGAMLANPVIGAVTWATQKLLADPIEQVFSYDYLVSGSWNSPKFEKLSAANANSTTSPATPNLTPDASSNAGASP